MKKTVICLLLFGIGLTVSAQEKAETVSMRYETQNDMPLFYQKLKESLTYPMAWRNSSIRNFEKWREGARKVLLDCMQPAPPVAAFDKEVIDTEQRNGYRAEKILFSVSEYSRVPAYLLVPDGNGPFPAVLLLHDHGAHFSIGKEKMVRPFGVEASVLADADDWAEKCYDKQYVGDYLASHGYVVLAVDALFWGERGRKEGVRYDSQQALAANMLQMGMSWGALIAWDDIRSAEFLASLPMVHKEKIGTMGFSMGAHRAWMVSAATDVVKAGAAVCWMNTTDSLMTLTNNQNKGGSAYSMIIPGIRNWMDYPHVASIACPKPMLFINGLRDKLFPVKGVESAFSTMQDVWKSQSVENLLTTKFYDLPHFCSKEIQDDILEFFNQGDEEIQDLLQGSRGLNLGLHFLSGALTFDPVATKVDPELASRIVWLDAYLTNIDRTFRNTNMLMWHKELWLIDHGASLYFHHSWENWEKHAVSPFTYIKNHVLLPEASRLEEADTLLRPMLTDEKIQQIVALIPDDWLHWEDTHETPEEIRDIYTRFLTERLAHSEIFIKEAQNARKALI